MNEREETMHVDYKKSRAIKMLLKKENMCKNKLKRGSMCGLCENDKKFQSWHLEL